MIDATEMDLEERKDLLYDIRAGKVKYEDVNWGYSTINNDYKELIDYIKKFASLITNQE